MTRHLIHIGYPKAGSTFLQRWFELHPELRYSEGGVAGFRNVYELCHGEKTRVRYYVTSCEGLSSPNEEFGTFNVQESGDIARVVSGIREKQAAVCTRLRTLYPGSRILIVTRGFKAMAFSGYSQYVRTGGTLDLPALWAQAAAGSVEQYYDFDYLIGIYAEAFGAENVIVLPYELLRDDQDSFVRVLAERLGLEHVPLRVGRVNASLSPEELYWYPRISRMVLAVGGAFGSTFRSRMNRWYVRFSFHNRLRPLIALLSRLRPGRRVTPSDFPEALLAHCAGKATLLRHDPLYAPHAAEYLWDEGAGSA